MNRIAAAVALTAFGTGCAAPTPTPVSDEERVIEADVDGASAVRYLLAHQKPNGAFGPAGHEHTDLAWNYPAVHALVLLREPLPRAEDCFRNGRGAVYKLQGSHDPNRAWDIYQRASLAAVLGRPGEAELELGGPWTLEFQDRKDHYYFKIPDAKLKARLAPFCDIPTLSYFVEALAAAGAAVANPETARGFLGARQVASGAFVDAYSPNGPPDEAEAHLVATAQAVFTFRALGFEVPKREACAAWIRSCQDASGGFRWSPRDPSPSNRPDVWYTWAAVRALELLGSGPADRAACVRWLNALQNPDGGFGDRPGWNSRLYSTYYAVHALHVLTGDARGAIVPKRARAKVRVVPEGRYRIYQAHLKSPPGGADMVRAVRRMGLDLIAIKDSRPGIPSREARAAARAEGLALEVLSCPEQYAYRLRWLGGQPAHHVANYFVPLDPSPEERARLEAADRAGREGLPWREFRRRVIAPIVTLGSLFYPEVDYEMTNAYMVYDDGLEGPEGYNGVIGGLGWPVWDWIRFFPYRERWVGKHPILVDGDAHGDLAKWGERLERQRMLYLARGPELEHFLEACRAGRTVCVIRGGEDRSELAFYGDPAVVAYVQARRAEWQWWK